MNLSTVKWAQWDKTQSRELLSLFICVCIALCTIVAHNIAQNRPDSFPPYPPDDHHSSDDVYLMEGGAILKGKGTFSYSERKRYIRKQISKEKLVKKKQVSGEAKQTSKQCIQRQNQQMTQERITPRSPHTAKNPPITFCTTLLTDRQKTNQWKQHLLQN